MESALHTDVQLNQWFLDPKRDERRNESLVLMKVVNRNTRAVQILQNMIGPGEQVIKVYRDEVPKVMAQVEREPNLIDEARKQYELEMAERVMQTIGGFQGTPADMLRLIKSKENDEVNEVYRKLLKTSPLSVEGVFRGKYKRDIQPLVSAAVIEGSEFAEPQREELDREVNRQAGSFALALESVADRVIAALQGKATPPAADVQALVKAEVERLLGGGDKPKAK